MYGPEQAEQTFFIFSFNFLKLRLNLLFRIYNYSIL